MPSLGSNQSYLVTVTKGASSTPGFTAGSNSVTANAAAKVGLEIQNNWVNILEALGLTGGDSGGIAGALGKAGTAVGIFSGNSFLPKIFTSHVWRSSSGLNIELQMRFDAWDDTVNDVLMPVQKLVAMFSPTRGSADGSFGSSIISAIGSANSTLGDLAGKVGQQFLHPPGPTPYEYLSGDQSNSFTVSLGDVMTITNLIPTVLRWEFEDRFADGGDPIAAMLAVGFTSYTTPDADEILGFFKHQVQMGAIGGSNQTPAAPAGGSPPSPSASPNTNAPGISFAPPGMVIPSLNGPSSGGLDTGP